MIAGVRADHSPFHMSFLVILTTSLTVGGVVSVSAIQFVREYFVDLVVTVGWKGEDDPLFQCHIKM